MKGTEENAGVRRGYTGICERVQRDISSTWNGKHLQLGMHYSKNVIPCRPNGR